jgi:hypothetical protein
VDCERKTENRARCNCSYDPCARKGICCECLQYHLKNRELPGCVFPDDAERTWNRSFDHFAKLVNEGRI